MSSQGVITSEICLTTTRSYGVMGAGRAQHTQLSTGIDTMPRAGLRSSGNTVNEAAEMKAHLKRLLHPCCDN